MSQPPNPQLEAFPDFDPLPPSADPLPPFSKLHAARPAPQQPQSSTNNPTQLKGRKRSLTMSYHNYLESPSSSFTQRQQQQLPSLQQQQQQQQQIMAHNGNGMNGMNGAGNGMPNGMVGYPTPAGHQSDLNYVMSMVDELSAILKQNQQLTASVVEKMGRVRERAAGSNMSNDEVIAAVAAEMNEESKNLEKQNSDLRSALEKSDYNKNENWRLAVYGAQIMADISEKMHKYKEQHEKDTLAWHKNYRSQLAAEREENLNLRQQINDMKASACRANGHLRDLRKWYNTHDEIEELKSQVQQYRLSSRYWKRMALPLLEDDDEEFSDDDDLIDPEEKKREEEKAELAKLAMERMQRDDIEGMNH